MVDEKTDLLEPWLDMDASSWHRLTRGHQGELPIVLFDGYDDQAVLIVKHDPEQMAHRMVQGQGIYFAIGAEGAYGNDVYYYGPDPDYPEDEKQPPKPGSTVPGNKSGIESYIPEVAKFLPIESPEDGRIAIKAASEYIRGHFIDRVSAFYGFFIAEVMNHSLRVLARERGEEWKASASDRDKIAELYVKVLKNQFEVRDPHRPEGGGLFKNCRDFMKAFEEVLADFPGKPTRIKVLERLWKHPLCPKGEDRRATQDDAQNLDYWIGKCGLRNFTLAVEKYQGRSSEKK